MEEYLISIPFHVCMFGKDDITFMFVFIENEVFNILNNKGVTHLYGEYKLYNLEEKDKYVQKDCEPFVFPQELPFDLSTYTKLKLVI